MMYYYFFFFSQEKYENKQREEAHSYSVTQKKGYLGKKCGFPCLSYLMMKAGKLFAAVCALYHYNSYDYDPVANNSLTHTRRNSQNPVDTHGLIKNQSGSWSRLFSSASFVTFCFCYFCFCKFSSIFPRASSFVLFFLLFFLA